MGGNVLEATALGKTFPSGEGELVVLENVELRVKRGEIISIVGASGAGKSTLLHVIGTLMRPTAGTVTIGGNDVFHMNDMALSRFRNERIGFVFQFHHLLPEFTALENVMLPMMIGGRSRGESRGEARELLESVDLHDRLNHLPSALSGGEQQRVAVVRAIATRPEIVLADEPSGNLDDRTSEGLHSLLWALREKFEQAFVIVTHDDDLAARADRQLRLEERRLVELGGRSAPAEGVTP